MVLNKNRRIALAAIIFMSCVFINPVADAIASDADRFWGQYHGPADGRAFLSSGPGPDLRLAWTNDMLDPNDDLSFVGNIGFDQDEIHRHGTLIRADDRYVYFRLSSDYQQSLGYLWRLDPVDGTYEQWSQKRSDTQDHTNPRSTQLADSPHPRSFRSFHAGAFYATQWSMFDVDDRVPYHMSELANSHSVRGSRVLGPESRWAWKNNKGYVSCSGISYYQGGSLYFWCEGDGRYAEFAWDHDNDPSTEKEKYDLALVDHAWDDERIVLFANDGQHADGSPYDNGRYVVLAADRPEVLANVVIGSDEIYHPPSPRQDSTSSYFAASTDAVNKLALDGRWMYAVERVTYTAQRLVCRDMKNGFSLNGFVDLPLSSQRSTSFCIDDRRVYVQFENQIRAYSKTDLVPDEAWGDSGAVATSHRTVCHSTTWQFGLCHYTIPGTESYPQQTIAADSDYIYFTTDSQFVVLNASDGSQAFSHTFSRMPDKATYLGSTVEGIAGDIVLTPYGIVVSSRKDSSWMWGFRPSAELSLHCDVQIVEGSEDGVSVTATLLGDGISFADPLNPENWSFQNLPAGVQIDSMQRVDDRHATCRLLGNRTDDYDSDIFDFTATVSTEGISPTASAPLSGRGIRFTALASIADARLSHDNSFADITFSRPVYGAEDLSAGVAPADFSIALKTNGGAVGSASIVSATDIYGLPLEGGETVVRLHLDFDAAPDGVEFVEIGPLTDEVFDERGNSVPATVTTGNLCLYCQDHVLTFVFRQGENNYSGGKDAYYINENNYGDNNLLQTWVNYQRNTMIAFEDLGFEAENVEVLEARLLLYAYDGSDLDDDDAVHVYQLTHDWTETGVTLSTFDGQHLWPQVYRKLSLAASLPMTAVSRADAKLDGEQWMSFDVTDAFAAWISGEPNYGLMLAVNEGKSAAIYWRSNEYQDDPSLRPALQVRYLDCENGCCGRHFLNYAAGPEGSISGKSFQAVCDGMDGSPVEAVPDTGYHFNQWSDGSTVNPRTDESVTADIDVTATFAINVYALAYAAGEHGAIQGDTSQTVEHGSDGDQVTAAPDTGYHFNQWSDGSTVNPRTDESVTADIDVTATFAINVYALAYAAGEHGAIQGDTSQTVEHGSDGDQVAAVPDTGYHFNQWSDGSTVNPRTDKNVTADIDVTAAFAINVYALAYAAGEHGAIQGDTSQTVEHGSDGDQVAAVPDTGYHFNQWSDGSSVNPRTDKNVTADIDVTAAFAINVYALAYAAGEHGAIQGDTSQTVEHGSDGDQVAAVPDTGYHFNQWSDGSAVNPRTDRNVTENISVNASFAFGTDLDGDIDGDLDLDLGDAVFGSQILVGYPPQAPINPCADANGDGTIGLEDLGHILRTVSDGR